MLKFKTLCIQKILQIKKNESLNCEEIIRNCNTKFMEE